MYLYTTVATPHKIFQIFKYKTLSGFLGCKELLNSLNNLAM